MKSALSKPVCLAVYDCVAGYANSLYRSNEEVICFHSVDPPWISSGITPNMFIDRIS